MKANFQGHVQQVVAGDVYNRIVHPCVAPPDDAHSGQATRSCPQCLKLTWAYNRHCHHCTLDIRAFELRKRWHSARYIVGALLALSALAWSKRSEAAPQDIEIVRMDPKAKRSPATPARLPNKAGAEAVVNEIGAVRYEVYKALRDQGAAFQLLQRISSADKRAKQVFGSPAMSQPFGRCLSALNAADAMVQKGTTVVRAQDTAPESVSALINWSIQLGDDYRTCRTEVEALPD